MATSLFAANKVKRKFHTPISFRAQRRLHFQTPNAQTPVSQSTLAAAHQLASLQDSTVANATDTSASANSANTPDPSASNNSPNQNSPTPLEGASTNTQQNNTANNAQQNNQLPKLIPLQDNRILPWDINGNKHTKLYSTAPPALSYPAGSRDDAVNDRFILQMDMYLNRNYLVRSVISGETPHPFSVYDRLNEYWSALGFPDKTFDTSQTFATLDEIKQNGHEAFHSELVELLWFGGVVSYGNIMAQVYAILYAWISPDDLPELEGLCEVNDGLTFRLEIINSLRVVRLKHTQAIIDNLYTKLDGVQLVMRPGGMFGFFAKLRKARANLIKRGENVSDSYLIRRTTMAVRNKHAKIDEVIAELRRKAGVSGVPTTFRQIQAVLVDTFNYEVPAGVKTEKPPKIPVNLANPGPNDGDGPPKKKQRKKKWVRPVFPKGSCQRCPDATDHTTKRCWVIIREQKGLPPGFKWCTVHEKGIHYDHECKRHAPNYPPVPTSSTPAAVANTSQESAEQFKDRLMALFSKGTPIGHSNGITVTCCYV